MELAQNILEKEPLVAPGKTYADVDNDVAAPLEAFPTKRWLVCLAIALTFFGIGAVLVADMIYKGLGVLGINHPVGWGVFIVDFVF